MTPVTDPNLISQLESGGGGQPVTDPNLINQLEGNTQANMPLWQRGGADILSGLAQMGHGLLNAPHNIANSIGNMTGNPQLGQDVAPLQPGNPDFSSILGVQNPNFGDKLLSGVAQYAPYVAGGEGVLAAKGLESIPLATRLTNYAGTGAAFGATQSDTPASSAALDSVLNVGGGLLGHGIAKGVGLALGTKSAQKSLSNSILDFLNGQSGKASALSPEDTAQNVANNYTNSSGQMAPIDIGTAANNPTLSNAYSALRNVPFSGVSDRMNTVQGQLADKGIQDAQGVLSTHLQQASGAEQDATNQMQQQGLQGLQDEQAITNQIAQNSSNPDADRLAQQINSMSDEGAKYSQLIDQAPGYFNSLADGVPDRSNITSFVKDSTKQVYDTNRQVSKTNYAPLNDSTIRLDQLGVDQPFSNYANAAQELLAKRENLTNLFGNDSDLGSKLNGELNKAQSMVENQDNYGVTLSEAIKRIQTLGQLSASATGQGNRYEGMLIGNLKNGLAQDVNSTLNQSGNGDLANQLLTANDYHAKSIVPFWQNNEIRKSVTDQSYIPAKAKLANALHDPNNQSILNQLPQDAKNASLSLLLSQGKGTSAGLSSMSAEDIGNSYSKVPIDAKRAIASYNPQADRYFEQLPGVVKNNQQINNAQDYLRNQLTASQKEKQASIDKLNSQLGKLRQNNLKNSQTMQNNFSKLSLSNIKKSQGLQQNIADLQNKKLIQPKISTPPIDSFYKGVFRAGSALGAPFGKSISKTLSSPELINAYVNKTRFPTSNKSQLNPYAGAGLIGLKNSVTGGNQQ